MSISGDNATFYNCKFIGFQDALCDDRGMHFFKDSYIEEHHDSFDWKIFGVITIQVRERVEDDSGFTFLYCNITSSGNNTMYLCRAWKPRPRVVFAFTNFDG
ncbi:hypothetical protein GOBAR_DD02991 [Gossypium barbadense]|nr:hypothetical protein GOBAR_DD02991 [Gossypium barbadense]